MPSHAQSSFEVSAEDVRSDLTRAIQRGSHVDGPFPVITANNVFSPETYDLLQESFPRLDDTWTIDTAFDPMKRTGTYDRGFWDALDGNDIWKFFTTALMTSEFIRLFALEIQEPLRTIARDGALLDSKLNQLLKQDPTETEYLDFMQSETLTSLSFLSMGQNDFNSPHVDAPQRIANLLMYFPELDWRVEWGGGTHFFEFEDNIRQEDWYSETSNARIDGGSIKRFANAARTFFTAPFVPNSCCVFVKTFNAFHSVSPIRCPPGRFRNVAAYSVALNRMQ